MKIKTWLIGTLLTVTIASVIGFMYWNSPERRIRAVLSDGKAAIEAKEMDRAMSHVSLQYRDENGLAYMTVKKLLKMAFDQFEGFELRLTNVALEIEKDHAVVRADLDVIGIHQKEKSYLIGSQQEPVPIRITLVKETMKWQVVSVDGIKMPFADF
ncbi:MAG: hypothetical protein HY204_12260 [Nitrospirae bacterium]|nr:hypothetical protein [Nitrospirota bacterium]